MAEGKLAGRVAIVTGSSRGIGKAIALGFAWEGARLVVCSRTAGGGELTVEATVRAIEEIGAEALGVACDVTQEDQVNEMVRQTIERWGRVDVLINNAGSKFGGPFSETSFAQWNELMRTNVDGVFLCTKAVLPHMLERHAGSIVTVSTGRAHTDDAVAPAYAASKAAAERLMIKLAAEVRGEGVALNILYPGTTLTETATNRGTPENPRLSTEQKRIIPACVCLATQTDEGISGQALDEADFGLMWP